MKNNEKEIVVDDFFDRIKQVLGLTTYAAALRKLDMERNALDNWRKRGVPEAQVIIIADKLKVTKEWLAFGEEPIKNNIVQEAEGLYKNADQVSLPYYPEVYASAGGGAMVYESLANTKPMQLSKAFVEDFLGLSAKKNIHILNVKGDSMEPTILDGELIFVAPLNGDGIVDGNIYVMMYENEIFVKRVRRDVFAGTYRLSSDNDAVDDIKLSKAESESCQIIGEVVGQMRRI